MDLQLVRDSFTDTTTEGRLYINGFYECETLEDCDRHLEGGGIKVKGVTAIPRGTYRVIIDYSNRFQRMMPHVLDVPGFDGIRIHSGNTAQDTEGCIILGQARGSQNSVSRSLIALAAFSGKLKAAFESGDTITLTVL